MEAHPTDTIDEPVTFDRPPVGEVAMSVQMGQPVTDDALTLGTFWPRVREEYPNVQTQPPLPPMSEDFRLGAPQSITFQLVGQSSRYWLLSPDATELIQVQPDRFGYNWRKEPVDAPYPRYRYLRERFHLVFSAFIGSTREKGRTMQPTWCEITYINPIETTDVAGGLANLSSVLRRLAPDHPGNLPPPQDTTFAERFLLTRDGSPTGRLYVSANPATRLQDQMPIYMLTLTVRGMPRTPDADGVYTFLDEGRDLIVRSFRDMTTPEMHAKWGLHESD
jgi:uncharacterized protein (TIGR04255 family)